MCSGCWRGGSRRDHSTTSFAPAIQRVLSCRWRCYCPGATEVCIASGWLWSSLNAPSNQRDLRRSGHRYFLRERPRAATSSSKLRCSKLPRHYSLARCSIEQDRKAKQEVPQGDFEPIWIPQNSTAMANPLRSITFLLIAFSGNVVAQRLVPSDLMIPAGGMGVLALEEYGGKLIVGGWLQMGNGQPAPKILAWDGDQVELMPGAFDEQIGSRVQALIKHQGYLYAAGQSVSIGHVARWDGSTWSSLGQGLPERANSLATYNGDLIAGCQNGMVMRWNGTTWQQVGETLNGAVLTVEVHQSSIYVGGEFTGISGNPQPFNRIARWTGSEWSAVANGFNGRVITLKSDALGLLIGGAFSFDADSSVQYPGCARVQANSLATIPGVSDGASVSGFFRLPDGQLVIGNATVDGFKFSMGNVRAMQEYNGTVYVGGIGNAQDAYRPTGVLAKLLPGTTTSAIDINRISAAVSPHPSSFHTWWGGSGLGFEVPKGEGTHTIYASSPWIKGYADGTLYQCAPRWRANANPHNVHEWAGPHADVMDDVYYLRYHRVWKLDRALVQEHIANWIAPGYSIPEPIASWPGNGNTANGEPTRLAPFADLDGNGTYEPELGEYPLIKGTQATYMILHTRDDESSFPAEPPPIIDVHVMHYAFEDVSAALDFTVFVNYRFVNRSGLTYDSVRVGQFNDLDIGCANDDLAGCDSTRGLWFTYNWTDFDPTCFVPGYGTLPPAQGARFLNAPLRSHGVHLREVPYFISTQDLFDGLYQGQPFMNLGYPTHYQYPGEPWLDIGSPAVPDRAQVGATGPYTLAPNDTLCIDLAFIYARASSGSAYASVEALKLRSDSVQSFYDTQGLACQNYPVMTTVLESQARQLGIFPNPTRDRFIIVADLPLGEILLTDGQGRLVMRMQVPIHSAELDVSDLAPGIYHIVARNEGRMTHARLVKQ